MAGLKVERHLDHCAADESDALWLPDVAARDWIVVSKDDYTKRDIERQAILTSGAREWSRPTVPETRSSPIRGLIRVQYHLLLNNPKLQHLIAPLRLHVDDVKPRSNRQVVIRPQIPRDKRLHAILHQRPDQHAA